MGSRKLQVVVFGTAVFVSTLGVVGLSHAAIEHRREWSSRGRGAAGATVAIDFSASLMRPWALAAMNYLAWVLPAVVNRRVAGARTLHVGVASALSAVGVHVLCWVLHRQLVLYNDYVSGALAIAGVPGAILGVIAWSKVGRRGSPQCVSVIETL